MNPEGTSPPEPPNSPRSGPRMPVVDFEEQAESEVGDQEETHEEFER